MHNLKRIIGASVVCAALVLLLGQAQAGQAQGPQPRAPQTALGTAFSYQGQLKKNSSPYTGDCNFQFSLWDALSSGAQLGSTQNLNTVHVNGGSFAVTLDFGSQFDGSARWLGMAVQCTGDGGFTTLLPRTALDPVPYALYAGSAALADVAGTAKSADTAGYASTAGLADSAGTAKSADTAGYALNLAPGSVISGTGPLGLQVNTPNGNAIVGTGSANGFATIYGGDTSPTGGYAVYGNSNKGTGVAGNSSSSYGVWGISGTSHGVVGTSTSGRGVWGYSTSGVGVYAQSDSGNAIVATTATDGYATIYGEDSSANGGYGVYGKSTKGQGLHGYTTSGPEGVFGQSDKSTGIGVHGYTAGNQAIGVWGESPNNTGVYGLSTNGTGVWGKSTGGFAMRAEGNTTQSLNAGGFVKAMVHVDYRQLAGQQILRCFNSQATGAAVYTPPCGFAASSPQLGYWDVNFGFDVSQRFVLATPMNESNDYCFVSACESYVLQLRPVGGNYAGVMISYNKSGNQTNAPFTLIVY